MSEGTGASLCPHCGALRAPLRLDAEFQMAARGEANVALGAGEYRALEALMTARRPVYSDYLQERVEAPTQRALHNTLFRLRIKLRALGCEVTNFRAGAGEPGAYALSIGGEEKSKRSAA